MAGFPGNGPSVTASAARLQALHHCMAKGSRTESLFRCEAFGVVDDLLLPGLLELGEGHAVMALERRLVAVAEAVLDELGENRGAALLRQEFDEHHALRIECADAARVRVIL